MHAVLEDNVPKVKETLLSGASPQAVTVFGNSAITRGAELGHEKSLEVCLDHAKWQEGLKHNQLALAMLLAAHQQKFGSLKALLRYDAKAPCRYIDVEFANPAFNNTTNLNDKLPSVLHTSMPDFGMTELHLLAAENNVPEGQKLLEQHPDMLNAPCFVFMTPAHIAAQEGSLEFLRWLLTMGADLSATNLIDETPLDTAKRHGYAAHALLQRAGAPSARDLEQRRCKTRYDSII
jgi:hypothetical protein